MPVRPPHTRTRTRNRTRTRTSLTTSAPRTSLSHHKTQMQACCRHVPPLQPECGHGRCSRTAPMPGTTACTQAREGCVCAWCAWCKVRSWLCGGGQVHSLPMLLWTGSMGAPHLSVLSLHAVMADALSGVSATAATQPWCPDSTPWLFCRRSQTLRSGRLL